VTPKLEKRLTAAANLPTLPGVAVELLAECRRAEVDLDRVCELVARDAALSVKLLGIANSPAYRRGAPVRTWLRKRGRRAEALDCRVYAFAALEALKSMGLRLDRHAHQVAAASTPASQARQPAGRPVRFQFGV